VTPRPALDKTGRLVAGIGITCVIEALIRWLDDPDAGSLVRTLDGVEAVVRALVPYPSAVGVGEGDPVRAESVRRRPGPRRAVTVRPRSVLVPRTLTRPLTSAFTANRPTSRSPSIARAT
jgi:hypothetical protein